jgi:hypothetical protein
MSEKHTFTPLPKYMDIYERRFLGDKDVFVLLDGNEVNVAALLAEIPEEVIRAAADSLRKKYPAASTKAPEMAIS